MQLISPYGSLNDLSVCWTNKNRKQPKKPAYKKAGRTKITKLSAKDGRKLAKAMGILA